MIVLQLMRGWRPFLGGDEDRNWNSTTGTTPSGCGVPSSEGTRIATPTTRSELTDMDTWRPFLGGDEDRNS